MTSAMATSISVPTIACAMPPLVSGSSGAVERMSWVKKFACTSACQPPENVYAMTKTSAASSTQPEGVHDDRRDPVAHGRTVLVERDQERVERRGTARRSRRRSRPARRTAKAAATTDRSWSRPRPARRRSPARPSYGSRWCCDAAARSAPRAPRHRRRRRHARRGGGATASVRVRRSRHAACVRRSSTVMRRSPRPSVIGRRPSRRRS